MQTDVKAEVVALKLLQAQRHMNFVQKMHVENSLIV
jgi:hypothetical protein